MAEPKSEVGFDAFQALDIRVGTITDARDFPEAHKPAYILTIDFGPELGTRTSSARITERYAKADLLGRQVAAVVNFPPKKIGPVRSECLVLGFSDERGRVVLVTPEKPVPNGEPLH
jgi:tRNA-binding protein